MQSDHGLVRTLCQPDDRCHKRDRDIRRPEWPRDKGERHGDFPSHLNEAGWLSLLDAADRTRPIDPRRDEPAKISQRQCPRPACRRIGGTPRGEPAPTDLRLRSSLLPATHARRMRNSAKKYSRFGQNTKRKKKAPSVCRGFEVWRKTSRERFL